MPPVSPTPPSLLFRLRATPGNADAWRQFDDIYRPLLTGWLRRYSLQEHDVADLVQEILQAVCRELPHFHYDPARGRFRGWLRQIMVNRLREFWRARKRDRSFVEPLVEQLQDPGSDLSQRWDREHDQHVLQVLLAQLEPDFEAPTWQAFRRLMAGEEPKAVAAALGLSVNAVFLARSRILKRLREAAQDLTD
jgi:RNA polymerase sigma-70 factor (ECF subfamily)